jgi:hypothetical protein
VDCLEIRRELLTGSVPFGPSLDEHLRGCAECAQLLSNGAALGRRLAAAAAEPSQSAIPSLLGLESLLASERGVRAFLRSRSTRLRFALSLLLPALLLARELWRKQLHWRGLSSTRALACLPLVGLIILVAYSALRLVPSTGRAHNARSLLAGIAWCAPCALWVLPEAQRTAQDLNSSFALQSLACFAYGSALAAPSLALLWVFDRAPRMPSRVWLLGVGMVALVANSILLLHCPISQRSHLLAGHFSIGLVWLAAVSVLTVRGHRAALP